MTRDDIAKEIIVIFQRFFDANPNPKTDENGNQVAQIAVKGALINFLQAYDNGVMDFHLRLLLGDKPATTLADMDTNELLNELDIFFQQKTGDNNDDTN